MAWQAFYWEHIAIRPQLQRYSSVFDGDYIIRIPSLHFLKIQSIVKQKTQRLCIVTFYTAELAILMIHHPIQNIWWLSYSWRDLLQPCEHELNIRFDGMHAGNVILEPHLPPRDKKVKHSLQPRLKPDGKALDRVHLAHKSAENTAILKPVSNSIDEKFNYYRLARTVQRDSLM